MASSPSEEFLIVPKPTVPLRHGLDGRQPCVVGHLRGPTHQHRRGADALSHFGGQKRGDLRSGVPHSDVVVKSVQVHRHVLDGLGRGAGDVQVEFDVRMGGGGGEFVVEHVAHKRLLASGPDDVHAFGGLGAVGEQEGLQIRKNGGDAAAAGDEDDVVVSQDRVGFAVGTFDQGGELGVWAAGSDDSVA